MYSLTDASVISWNGQVGFRHLSCIWKGLHHHRGYGKLKNTYIRIGIIK